MKRLLATLVLLLVCAAAHGQQQQLICQNAGAQNQIPCSTAGPPVQSGSNDPGWLAYGKLNSMLSQLFSLYPSSPPGQVPSNATILQDWPLSGAVEAFDYGCKTTVNVATADSTPCLQAAANAASLTRNRTLHIPGGTYYIRTRWNCPANGIVLRGDGWNLVTAGVGTWLHIATSQFAAGGPQAGNHPFQCGSSAQVNGAWVDSIAFTEDQPADNASWAPISYGAMWIFGNGSANLRFTNDYFAGVNYALELLSTQGGWFENNYLQVFTTGVQIDHNADWLHVAHNHFNDFFCSVSNCPNITLYIQTNAIGFQSNRNDNPSFVDTEAFGLNTLLALGTDATGVTTNAAVTQMDCDKCFHTVNITAAGTSGRYDQLNGHTFNFAGSAALRGGTILSESGGTAQLSVSNLRCQNAGDACVSLGGSGDDLKIVNSYLFSWAQNSAANGTCDGTVYAINAGAANANTVRISNVTFSAGGCSSLTYASSNTVSASNAQYGSWTPALAFGGGNTGLTYTAHTGQVQVDDHKVTVQFIIALSAVGSSTGNATVTGLPFTVAGSGNWGAANLGACINVGSLQSLTGPVLVYASANGTTANLVTPSATGIGTLSQANFTNSSSIRCALEYFMN